MFNKWADRFIKNDPNKGITNGYSILIDGVTFFTDKGKSIWASEGSAKSALRRATATTFKQYANSLGGSGAILYFLPKKDLELLIEKKYQYFLDQRVEFVQVTR